MVQSKPLHLGETLLVAFAGGFLFDLARFPAGWMAGAMVAVAIAALAGPAMFMPTLLARVFFIALGITVGGIATPDTVRGMMTWPLNIVLIAVAMLVTTLAASVYLTRVHGWSAQTAMFAAVPGALSQVVVMAADRDADLRGIVVVQTVRAIVTTIGVPIALILFGLAGPAAVSGLGARPDRSAVAGRAAGRRRDRGGARALPRGFLGRLLLRADGGLGIPARSAAISNCGRRAGSPTWRWSGSARSTAHALPQPRSAC